MPKDWRENAITATVLGAELWSPGTRRLPNGGVANVFNLPINLIGNNANQVNLFPISSPYFLGNTQEASAGIGRFTPIFSHRMVGKSAPRRPDGKTQTFSPAGKPPLCAGQSARIRGGIWLGRTEKDCGCARRRLYAPQARDCERRPANARKFRQARRGRAVPNHDFRRRQRVAYA